MRVFRREKSEKDHDTVTRTLTQQEKQLVEHARRLRALELEVGIIKPPVLKEVNNP